MEFDCTCVYVVYEYCVSDDPTCGLSIKFQAPTNNTIVQVSESEVHVLALHSSNRCCHVGSERVRAPVLAIELGIST